MGLQELLCGRQYILQGRTNLTTCDVNKDLPFPAQVSIESGTMHRIVLTHETRVRQQKPKADSTLGSSRAVPHPSTNRALRRLTSEVRRDPVYSTRYGRQLTACLTTTHGARPSQAWDCIRSVRNCQHSWVHSATWLFSWSLTCFPYQHFCFSLCC